MTERFSAGYRFIQIADISSSTDASKTPHFPHLTKTPFQVPSSLLLIRGRRSYRSDICNMPQNPALTSLNHSIVESSNNNLGLSTRKSLIILIVIFGVFVLSLLHVYSTFPKLSEEERVHIKLPRTKEDAKQLGIVLDRYKDDNYHKVLVGVLTVYIFLQTFAIPGSLFLSILSGFLFPFPLALVLVCTCSAIGATLCFLVSQLVGKRIICRWYPEKVKEWAVTINNQRDNLFNYIVFLRITPFLPNWFINLTAPIVGVPIKPFVFGTFFGVAPPSFIAIQTGQTLHSVTDAGVSWTSIILLTFFALVSLVPIAYKNRLKEKFA